MSLYGAFDSTKHLDELDDPLDTQEGVLTPAVRKARVMANLSLDVGLTATATNDLALKTTSDNRQVELNSRAFTQATGDSIAFQAVPNQTVNTTGEVFGGQIKPRVASGINAATVNGLGIDSELKGSGAGALSSDLRGINMYMGATGSGTIGGDIVGIRFRVESNINPTGYIVPFAFVQHEGTQGWDGIAKFTEALGSNSMTTSTDKTGNAKSGTIKVIANGTVYHIQLYANA
jgi:hypothetical protein